MAEKETPKKEETEKEETKEIKVDEKQAKRKETSRGVIYTVIAIAFLAIGFFVGGSMQITTELPTGQLAGTGDIISADDAGAKLVDFLQIRLSLSYPGIEIELAGVGDYDNVPGTYEVNLKITFQGQAQEVSYYVTKDGNYMFSGVADLNEELPESQPQQQPADVPKSDKPKVELFVMTHCPYGTQAEKAMIPAIKTLGDKIDAKIRFVHYFMHAPEEDETPIQVCIREEQPDKFLDYLECFLEDGDSGRCLSEKGLNVDSCVENNADGYYEEDSALSQGYGVGGSPTLVINGAVISFTRSPAGALSIICSAFNTPPEECSQTLSTQTASPGFGGGTGSSSGGQC